MDEVIVHLGFARTKKFYLGGYIIRLFEKHFGSIDASHAFVEIGNDIIESNFPRGQRINKTEWLKRYHIVESYAFKITVDRANMDLWINKKIVDRPYSLAQNAIIGATGLFIQLVNPLNWSFIEKFKFNGRVAQNCTEAQLMFAKKFLKFQPSEGLDHYSVSEARDFVKSVWEVRGIK